MSQLRRTLRLPRGQEHCEPSSDSLLHASLPACPGMQVGSRWGCGLLAVHTWIPAGRGWQCSGRVGGLGCQGRRVRVWPCRSPAPLEGPAAPVCASSPLSALLSGGPYLPRGLTSPETHPQIFLSTLPSRCKLSAGKGEVSCGDGSDLSSQLRANFKLCFPQPVQPPSPSLCAARAS